MVEEEPRLRCELKVACQWLEAKLLALLRTDRSLVYNVNVTASPPALSGHALVNVSYGCEPGKAEAVLELALGVCATAEPSDEVRFLIRRQSIYFFVCLPD